MSNIMRKRVNRFHFYPPRLVRVDAVVISILTWSIMWLAVSWHLLWFLSWCAFVFWECSHKLPRTWDAWDNRSLFSHRRLEVQDGGISGARCLSSLLPSGGCRSSQAFLGLQQHDFNLCLHRDTGPSSSCIRVFTWCFFSRVDSLYVTSLLTWTPVRLDEGSILLQNDLILTYVLAFAHMQRFGLICKQVHIHKYRRLGFQYFLFVCVGGRGTQFNPQHSRLLSVKYTSISISFWWSLWASMSVVWWKETTSY